MPIYETQCQICFKEREIVRSFADYDDLPECCGQRVKRLISRPAAIVQDIQPYRSMITGEMITCRRQHRTHLKDHGCIEVGNEKLKPKRLESPPGLKEEIIKQVHLHKKARRRSAA